MHRVTRLRSLSGGAGRTMAEYTGPGVFLASFGGGIPESGQDVKDTG